MPKKANSDSYTKSSGPKVKTTTIGLLTVVGSATSTTTNPPPPMPPMEVVTVTANFTPPALAPGFGAILQIPTVKLQQKVGGVWVETGISGAMNFSGPNQYTFTFTPQPPGDYRGFVLGNWMVTGSIADNGPTNQV